MQGCRIFNASALEILQFCITQLILRVTKHVSQCIIIPIFRDNTWIGLHLFNIDTCPPGHISHPMGQKFSPVETRLRVGLQKMCSLFSFFSIIVAIWFFELCSYWTSGPAALLQKYPSNMNVMKRFVLSKKSWENQLTEQIGLVTPSQKNPQHITAASTPSCQQGYCMSGSPCSHQSILGSKSG